MTGEIVDQYHRLIHPEVYVAWQSASSSLSASAFSISEAEAVEVQRARWRQHLSRFDSSILEAVGFTVDDLIDARYQRLKERAAGNGSPMSDRRKKQRESALLAIHKADKAGMAWTEAIVAVGQASQMLNGQEINRKTIDRWLRDLHSWGMITLQPPPAKGRGRPRKRK